MFYTIKKGDTLTKIARQFGVTIKQLMAWNPSIKNPDIIYAGNSIRVSAPDVPTSTPTVPMYPVAPNPNPDEPLPPAYVDQPTRPTPLASQPKEGDNKVVYIIGGLLVLWFFTRKKKGKK